MQNTKILFDEEDRKLWTSIDTWNTLSESIRKKTEISVLELGCGSGRWMLDFCKCVPNTKKVHVTVSDININAVEYACELLHKSYNKRIKSINGIVSNMFNNIPKQKFDVIFFNPPQTPSLFTHYKSGGRLGTKYFYLFLDSVKPYLFIESLVLFMCIEFSKGSQFMAKHGTCIRLSSINRVYNSEYYDKLVPSWNCYIESIMSNLKRKPIYKQIIYKFIFDL